MFTKIWDAHLVTQEDHFPAIVGIDLLLIHELSSSQACDILDERKLSVLHPERCLATIDHSIPSLESSRVNIQGSLAKKQIEQARANANKYGFHFYDVGSGHQGIFHIISPELGATQPGMTIVCGDSHTSTHGAFGAYAFGVGSTEIAYVLAVSSLLQYKPKTMKVLFTGSVSSSLTAKDMIMRLISQVGVGGANGFVIEFVGEPVKQLSMEARMTLCNMSIECGARAGMIAPDTKTYQYLKGRPFAPKGAQWDEALAYWGTLVSDSGCSYDYEINIDLSDITSMISWGINPSQTIGIYECIPELSDIPRDQQEITKKAYQYTCLKPGQKILGVPIQWAFVGSCTNGRIEDLRIVAHILNKNKISENVTMLIVPGSEQVRQQAIDEGLADIFKKSGADFRMPGCSLCVAMNGDIVPPGERCISTSNRNFMGRQGSGSITHLASPAVVAASAIKGEVATVNEL